MNDLHLAHEFVKSDTTLDPGQWQKRGNDVVVRCPRCDQESVLNNDWCVFDHGPYFQGDGIVHPPSACPNPACNFRGTIKLLNWGTE